MDAKTLEQHKTRAAALEGGNEYVSMTCAEFGDLIDAVIDSINNDRALLTDGGENDLDPSSFTIADGRITLNVGQRATLDPLFNSADRDADTPNKQKHFRASVYVKLVAIAAAEAPKREPNKSHAKHQSRKEEKE